VLKLSKYKFHPKHDVALRVVNIAKAKKLGIDLNLVHQIAELSSHYTQYDIFDQIESVFKVFDEWDDFVDEIKELKRKWKGLKPELLAGKHKEQEL
jgi:hypothetical protein